MKYVAVVAGLTVLLVDTLLRFAIGEPPVLRSLAWTFVEWLLWGALAPLVVRLATAVRYRRGRRWRFFLVHTAAAVALTIVHWAVFALLRTLVRGMPGQPGQPLGDMFLRWMASHITLGLLAYGGTVAATLVTFYLQASRKREEERLALERWLAQAELDLYRLQLPVEVVNERLLKIERTIAHDADQAELMIEEFGAYLRASLAAVNVRADVDEIAQDEEEMEEELPRPRSLPLRLLLLASIFPAVHLFLGTVFLISTKLRHQPMPFDLLPYVFRGSTALFPLTLLLVWLGSRVRRVWLLAAATATLPFLWIMGIALVLDGPEEARATFVHGNRRVDFLIFFALALGSFTQTRYRASRAAAVAVAQLESRVLRTRATMLRLQLNPHFLFNTLNSVAALLEDDAAAATKMAAQLRHFVARVLESSGREEVPLAEELESVAEYVAIENMRFDGRVELHVRAEEDARRALVPGFVLQPLVENALRHGLMPETGGRVSVLANVRDGDLHIEVADNGRSYDAGKPAREGVGLSNTRTRLAQMYGDGFDLEITRKTEGFRVALAIPYLQPPTI